MSMLRKPGEPSLARLAMAVCLAIGLTVVAAAAPRAEAVREISWDDLVPPQPPLVDPFKHLSLDEKIELGFIFDMRRQLELGYVNENNGNIKYAREMTAKLTAQGLDVDALLIEDRKFRETLQARGQAVVAGLDGQVVKMPGYALPLEFSNRAIRKFLLVPYVGACIHVPAPPPNQLIVVNLETPYMVKDIYDPIWITGRLQTKAGTELLNFVDGAADVQSGYVMNGMEIKPYEE